MGGIMSVPIASRLLVLMLITIPAAAQQNPFVGTWMLNPEKSRFGESPRLTQTTVLRETRNGLSSTTMVVYEGGQAVQTHWTAATDGTAYPLDGDTHYDTISVKRINDRTLEVVSQKGKVVGRKSTWEISRDSKTMTRTQTVVTAENESVENVLVFDRL